MYILASHAEDTCAYVHKKIIIMWQYLRSLFEVFIINQNWQNIGPILMQGRMRPAGHRPFRIKKKIIKISLLICWGVMRGQTYKLLLTITVKILGQYWFGVESLSNKKIIEIDPYAEELCGDKYLKKKYKLVESINSSFLKSLKNRRIKFALLVM